MTNEAVLDLILQVEKDRLKIEEENLKIQKEIAEHLRDIGRWL